MVVSRLSATFEAFLGFLVACPLYGVIKITETALYSFQMYSSLLALLEMLMERIYQLNSYGRNVEKLLDLLC